MAEKGATVIITGRDGTRGASTVEEIRVGGHDAQFIAADFAEMPEVRRGGPIINVSTMVARRADGVASHLTSSVMPTPSRWLSRAFRLS